MAFVLLACLFGGLAGIFYSYASKLSFVVYLSGLFVGYVLMTLSFYQEADAWRDIIGALYLLIFFGIGLFLAIITQLLGWWLRRRKKQP